ncbi:hypothetical protein ACH5RR_006185 [Cinchona calisaya]|uniref:Protein PLASTID MOVEMENT IMPAIRED 1-RELATED 1-like n=1 Tax=Cinchona calisaya TaxID=153742 RepID=A0ABD3ANB9_9GENT
MLSKVDGRKKAGENSGAGKLLLNDIETISKALYLDKTRPRSLLSTVSSRSKSVGKISMPESKSKSSKEDKKDSNDKDKKSIWSWKGFKSLTHVRNRRFNCCFSLQVHSIEGLPEFFDDLSLLVHWKRRDGELTTHPVMVFQGVAEFEEQLKHSCSIYGSRSGPHHSAKYEAKHFLLYASVYGTPELDLGKHRIDLTRLLPLTLEELEEEKSSGKWTTSFRLSGKAQGALLNVSFGYEIIGDNKTKDVSELRNLRQHSTTALKLLERSDPSHEFSTIRRTGSLPAISSSSKKSVEDIKDLHEVLPISKSELSDSISVLYQKLDEEKLNVPMVPVKPEVNVFPPNPVESIKPDMHLSSDVGEENDENEFEVTELTITEQGAELSSNEQEKRIEGTGNAAHDCAGKSVESCSAEVVPVEETNHHSSVQDQDDKLLASGCKSKDTDLCTKESLMKELESALSNVSDLMKEGLEDSQDESEISTPGNHLKPQSSHRELRKARSLSLDDVTETVASDFLDLLGIEHSPFGLSSESEPESPRERLLRQFEKDSLANGCSLFNFVTDEDELEVFYDAATESEWGMFSKSFDPSPVVHNYEPIPNIEADAMRHKTRASVLEDMETEALMREWGLNEKAFQNSPPSSSGGFGSPIDMPPEIPHPLPSLGEGLGPFVQTKDGGFLRSMNPMLFSKAKGGGSLIMQVSSPVVMPAEMGSGVMDILQHLVSVGIEKLSMQANKLMPLEDITGMTMQQIAWEAAPSLDGPERQDLQQHESGFEKSISAEHEKIEAKTSGRRNIKSDSNAVSNRMDAEYVSLEDLAPLAMDKIEALAIEGLRIQSGMSDQDAPLNISPHSMGECSAFEGKMVHSGGSLGLEGAGGLKLLDIKESGGGGVDGLMGLSLTLDEWMRLDSGEIDDEDCISERTSKLLAAHHASCLDVFRGRSKAEKRKGKGRNCGLLGNNFTVALMVQLRDPLRNYEPVGTPMLALIQVERVFIPPKPRIYSTVSLVRDSNEDDDETTEPVKKDMDEELKQEEVVPEEERIPQFKITEVHVAGLKTQPGKKKLWGSNTQQQSGSRWLLANGMGKKNKHPLMKSKAGAKSSLPAPSSNTTTVQPGETLWSISSRVHGTGAKWKELAALNPHIRNPNIIFPNETIRLR